jgi:uroporphyrinogen-III synthase
MRVLVTRPEPGASRTAEKLRAMGFEPVVLPLSETKPLAVTDDSVPVDVAGVAVTSANAIRYTPAHLARRLAALPCHAVGRRTADAVSAAGFMQVIEGPGDALGLADGIAGQLAGKVLVYLCGRERFPGFEERLALAGVQVHPIETYETLAMNYSDDAVLARLSGRPVDALLLYSAKAAEAARRLAMRPGLQALFGSTEVYALSGRIAAAYRPTPTPDPSPTPAPLGGGEAAAPESPSPQGRRRRGGVRGGGTNQSSDEIHIAPAPTEEALLALLARAR